MTNPPVTADQAGHSAMKLAERVQAEVSARGFDWPDAAGVLEKVREEVEEIQVALESGDLDQARRELGDLLLVSVNLARFLHADPEQVLSDALSRFQNRVRNLESALVARGVNMESCTLAELDAVWDQVKVVSDQGRNHGA